MKPIRLICFAVLIFAACKTDQKKESNVESYTKISGRTMGTTYNITLQDSNKRITKIALDSILIDINDAVSTYIPSSLISQINNDSLFEEKNVLVNGELSSILSLNIENNTHFNQNFEISKLIYKITDGYFDPTVMPLVNFWGFGYTEKKAVTEIDSVEVKNIAERIGFDKWSLNQGRSGAKIVKNTGAELDFSAVAKGYGVDVLSQYIASNQIKNYMVEIGGEVYASGVNDKGLSWKLGLSTPVKNAPPNQYSGICVLSDKALASSGNYRNFYDVNGVMYGHEINPKTGFPEINELLGTSVVADNCAEADAFATAFMVMGLDKSIEMVEKIDNIEACFFYRDSTNEISKVFSQGFSKYLEEINQ